jgi:hypothetical protein
MKTFQNQAAQGDLLITRVETLPDGITPAAIESGEYIVAHSETGHHHVVSAADCQVYETADPLVAYLVVDNTVEFRHKRESHTHESIQAKSGVFRLDRQREYTPEGFRRAAD